LEDGELTSTIRITGIEVQGKFMRDLGTRMKIGLFHFAPTLRKRAPWGLLE
jgi:hypothetical protein